MGETFAGGRDIDIRPQSLSLLRYLATTLPAITLLARLYRASRPLAQRPIHYKTAPRSISCSKIAAAAATTTPTPVDLPRHTANMPTTLKQFESVFPKLVSDLKQHAEQYKLPTQALKWFEEVGHT